jgi:hypothetical protein
VDWTLSLAIYGSALATINLARSLFEGRRARKREREAEDTAVEVSIQEHWVGGEFAPYVVVLNRGRRRAWVEVIGATAPDDDYGFDDRLERELRSLDRDQSADLYIPPGTFEVGQKIVGFAELTSSDEALVSEPLRVEPPPS